MYLYISLYNEDTLASRRCSFSGKYLDNIKRISPAYSALDGAVIEGCIGLIRGQEAKTKPCVSLKIERIQAQEHFLTLEFSPEGELDLTNEQLNKALYKYAKQENWLNEEESFYPLVCVLEKLQFDGIRKGTPNLSKGSTLFAQVDALRAGNDWEGICALYEPLESLREKEIWQYAPELYSLAFACSKLGEPKNGLERDSAHLKKVERYRELSLALYKRCHELDSRNSRYAAGIAYRHYQNICELTKPKGRRDGSLNAEIAEALDWFEIALEVNPKSIKDLYRKGRIILYNQLPAYKRSEKQWSSATYREIEGLEQNGVRCLERVILEYEELSPENNSYYRNEYVKSLYCLGAFYSKKLTSVWNQFIGSRLLNLPLDYQVPLRDMEYAKQAAAYLKKCFQAESDMRLDGEADFAELVTIGINWAVSPVDKLYRLGQIYFEMYLIKALISQQGDAKAQLYGQRCEKFLRGALYISDEQKRRNLSRRNTAHVSARLADYYILTNNYESAIRLTERMRDGYIKNTYAVALLLSDRQDRLTRAERVLREAADDHYNLAKGITNIWLAFAYTLGGTPEKTARLTAGRPPAASRTEKILQGLLQRYEGGNHAS